MKSFRFTAVAAVLLVFCLVFMAPVSAETCAEDSCSHVAAVGDVHYSTLQDALNAANSEKVVLLQDITVDISSISGDIYNAIYETNHGESENIEDGERFYAPYQNKITSHKVLIGTVETPVDLTLYGSYTGSNAVLLSGKMTVTGDSGIYGSEESMKAWMNVNVNGGYTFGVGYTTEDISGLTFDGTNPIAQLNLESGAEIARIGHIFVGSDEHDKGENAYVLNINSGATLKDFGQLTTRGDGTINVDGSITCFTTKSYQSSSAAATSMHENAKDGGHSNNNGVINVGESGSIKIDSMNIGRKPSLNTGNAELNVNGGTVEFTNYINVGYDSSARIGEINLNDGAKLTSQASTYTLKYNNGKTAGTETKTKDAGTLTIGVAPTGVVNMDASSKISVGTINVGESGSIIIDASGFTASEATKVIEQTVGTTSLEEKVTVNNLPAGYFLSYEDGDVTIVPYVASVTKADGTTVGYATLEVAVEAAEAGDTIVLLEDVTLTETLTIPAGKTVTLDLNGLTISQVKDCTASYYMIGNSGSLTIVDNVGGGKLSFTDSGIGDPNFGWGSYTIHNSGTLIIGDESKEAVDFTIEHIGSQTSHCANAIFQYSGSTTIYGGKISTPNYRSVRLWMGELTIYDGTFTGNVWVHNAAKWDTNTVNIYGGTFSPGTKSGSSAYSLLISNTMNQITLNIDGGIFTSDISVSDDTKITASISSGTFTNDVSAYVADGYICIQETDHFVVQKKSETTVVPDVPVESETVTDETTGTTTILTPSEDTDVTQSTNDEGETVVTITPPTTDDSSAVTITITGTEVSVDENKVTVPETASITATYKESVAETDGETTPTEEPQVTFQLSVNIENITKPLPVIDAKMIDEEKKAAVKEHSGKEIKSFLASFTALGDNDKNGVNDNLKADDGKHAVTFVVKVHKSLVSNPHLMAALHVDEKGKPKTGSKPTLTWEEDGEFYVVTITGPNFSSYVLVEEEPEEGDIVNNNNGGSGKGTGSGNYQYYPRDVPTNGIVDFGTSKVVAGMELPAGSSGKVTLNTKPTFAMPENGFYAFEIDAPGYNLEAKINGGLSFQIPVADLEAAGFTAKDIVLFHGNVNEDGTIAWEELPTNLVKNENGIAYYKAAINGCSPFYIGFVKDGSIVNTEVVDPVTPPTETPDIPGTDLPEIPPVDEPEEPSSPAPLAAVIAALGAAVILRRK